MKLSRLSYLVNWRPGAAALPALVAARMAKPSGCCDLDRFKGYPPGISPDITARLVAQSLSQRLGQQVIVDNWLGSGSNIAAETVVRSGARWLYAPAHDGDQCG